MDALARNFVCTLLSFNMCVACGVLSFPSLAMSNDFPLKTTMATILLMGNMGPCLTLLVSFLIKTLTKFIAKFVRIHLGMHSLLSNVVAVATLFSVGLRVTNSGLSVTHRGSAVFASPTAVSIFKSVSLVLEGLVVSTVLVVIYGILLSLCFRAGGNFLLHTMNSGDMLMASLSGSGNAVGVVKLMVSGTLITLSNTITYRRRHSFSTAVKANRVIFNLTTIVVKAALFEHMDFVGNAATMVFNDMVCGTYVRVTVDLNLPTGLLGLVATILFLTVLILNGLRGNSIGGGIKTWTCFGGVWS